MSSVTTYIDKIDRKLNIKTSRKSIGCARVNTSSLEFVEGREIDHRIVQGLVDLFDNLKCQRYNPDNYIRVAVTKEQLKNILRLSKLTQNALKSPCQDGSLPFIDTGSTKLICYEGQHRVKAAETFFEPDEHWWTVRLFLKSSEGDDVTRQWKDQFYYQSNSSDGELYRKIRMYHKKNIQRKVDASMQRLSRYKRSVVKRLLKRDDFTASFDGLLSFPGLWGGLELGNIERHLALRCDEEILRYLNYIKTVWDKITLNNKGLRAMVDLQTVEALESRTPASSTRDRDFVVAAMRTRFLFPKVTSKDTRQLLKKSLLRTTCIIPSIKSMHENLKYLAVGAKLIKNLILGNDGRLTVYHSLKKQWKRSPKTFLETSQGKISPTGLSNKACWELVYKQIWIAVLRNFAELGGREPRKEVNQRPYAKIVSPSLQYGLAKLVRDSGVETPKISERLANDLRRETLRVSVAQLYTSRSRKFQERLIEKMLHELPESINLEKPRKAEPVNPSIAADDLERRWGIPFQKAYEAGKKNFFLPDISHASPSRLEENLSLSFIQRDFIFAFFGPTKRFSAAPIEDDSDSGGDETEESESEGEDKSETGTHASHQDHGGLESDSESTSTEASSVPEGDPMHLDEQVDSSSNSRINETKTNLATGDALPATSLWGATEADSRLPSLPVVSPLALHSLRVPEAPPKSPPNPPMFSADNDNSSKEPVIATLGPQAGAVKVFPQPSTTLVETGKSIFSVLQDKPRSPLDVLSRNLPQEPSKTLRSMPSNQGQTPSLEGPFTIEFPAGPSVRENSMLLHNFESNTQLALKAPQLQNSHEDGESTTMLPSEPPRSPVPSIGGNPTHVRIPQTKSQLALGIPQLQSSSEESSRLEENSTSGQTSLAQLQLPPKALLQNQTLSIEQARSPIQSLLLSNGATTLTNEKAPIDLSFDSQRPSLASTVELGALELRRSALEPGNRDLSDTLNTMNSGRWSDLDFGPQQSIFSVPPSLPRSGINSLQGSASFMLSELSKSPNISPSVGEVRSLSTDDEIRQVSFDTNIWPNSGIFILPQEPRRSTIASLQDRKSVFTEGLSNSSKYSQSIVKFDPLPIDDEMLEVSLNAKEWSDSGIFGLPQDPRRSAIPSLEAIGSSLVERPSSWQQASLALREQRGIDSEDQFVGGSSTDATADQSNGEKLRNDESTGTYDIMSEATEAQSSRKIQNQAIINGIDLNDTVIVAKGDMQMIHPNEGQSEASDMVMEAVNEAQPDKGVSETRLTGFTKSTQQGSEDFIKAKPPKPRLLLRFCEYNGMILKQLERSPESMETYLSNRSGYIMYSLDSRKKAFKAIHKAKVIQTMTSYPASSYCLVKREHSEWWRQKGAKHMADGTLTGKNFQHPGLLASTSGSLRRAQGRRPRKESVVTSTRAHSDLKNYKTKPDFASESLKSFPPDATILDCELYLEDFKLSKPDDQICFLLQRSKDRSLQTFDKSLLPLSETDRKAIDPEFKCLCMLESGPREIILQEVELCVEQFTIWLVARAEVQLFIEEREKCRAEPARAYSGEALPVHPRVMVGDEALFNFTDDSDADTATNTGDDAAADTSTEAIAAMVRLRSDSGNSSAVALGKDRVFSAKSENSTDAVQEEARMRHEQRAKADTNAEVQKDDGKAVHAGRDSATTKPLSTLKKPWEEISDDEDMERESARYLLSLKRPWEEISDINRTTETNRKRQRQLEEVQKFAPEGLVIEKSAHNVGSEGTYISRDSTTNLLFTSEFDFTIPQKESTLGPQSTRKRLWEKRRKRQLQLEAIQDERTHEVGGEGTHVGRNSITNPPVTWEFTVTMPQKETLDTNESNEIDPEQKELKAIEDADPVQQVKKMEDGGAESHNTVEPQPTRKRPWEDMSEINETGLRQHKAGFR